MGGRGGTSHRATGGRRFQNAEQFLKSAYGNVHAQAILNIIQNAPQQIQELWSEFGSNFRASRMDRNSREAYYSPGSDSVSLGIDYVARGDAIATPYSTVFHEYGHMADYLIARTLGRGNYSAYSDTYKRGLLGRTAKSELEGRISSILNTHPNLNGNRNKAARMLIREASNRYSLLDRSDISDMFEGAGIGISHPLGAGHGLDYWSSRGNGKEIFAEITSAETAHPGSLKAIKEYFPKTYRVYQQMLKERKQR